MFDRPPNGANRNWHNRDSLLKLLGIITLCGSLSDELSRRVNRFLSSPSATTFLQNLEEVKQTCMLGYAVDLLSRVGRGGRGY